MELVVFYIFAGLAVLSALLVVLQRSAVYSALSLIVCFGSMAALFYQLGAHFIAAIQVIVYAGAIMVLFLFVVMLIDPESEVFTTPRWRGFTVLAVPLAGAFGFILLRALPEFLDLPQENTPLDLAPLGDTATVARSLFRDYLLPFEITSILILVAVLGALVLAKRAE